MKQGIIAKDNRLKSESYYCKRYKSERTNNVFTRQRVSGN